MGSANRPRAFFGGKIRTQKAGHRNNPLTAGWKPALAPVFAIAARSRWLFTCFGPPSGAFWVAAGSGTPASIARDSAAGSDGYCAADLQKRTEFITTAKSDCCWSDGALKFRFKSPESKNRRGASVPPNPVAIEHILQQAAGTLPPQVFRLIRFARWRGSKVFCCGLFRAALNLEDSDAVHDPF